MPLQANSASVGLESNNLSHGEGPLTASGPLLAADGAVRVSARDDSPSYNAAVISVDGSEELQQSGNAGQTQGPTAASISDPHIGAEIGGKGELAGAASKPTAAEPSTKQQEAEHSHDQSADRLEAVGAGPARLDADISQLPERLRHIKFSGGTSVLFLVSLSTS